MYGNGSRVSCRRLRERYYLQMPPYCTRSLSSRVARTACRWRCARATSPTAEQHCHWQRLITHGHAQRVDMRAEAGCSACTDSACRDSGDCHTSPQDRSQSPFTPLSNSIDGFALIDTFARRSPPEPPIRVSSPNSDRRTLHYGFTFSRSVRPPRSKFHDLTLSAVQEEMRQKRVNW